MKKYQIGQVVVQCNPVTDSLQNSLKLYYEKDDHLPRINLSYSDDILKGIQNMHPNLTIDQCEHIYSLELFANKIIPYGGLLLHGTIIVVNDAAYIFCGPGNVGKTTQARLWIETLGDGAYVFADDRPVLFYTKETIEAFNTPWSKVQYEDPYLSVPVKAIVSLQQDKNNSIVKLRHSEATEMLMNFYPKEFQQISLELIKRIVTTVPCWIFRNNASAESVRQAFLTIESDSMVGD